ncbi:uncharacterized protein LOC112558920 [Pomacea canaliculata]|uniref:uncharacterized protein LOC112558920 n=1 Tax=Pomacea canaliculata TaxID=400727 RepID=UPI000D73CF85|nr:uncharacterized protein LOC112558920 [Pomacea canaliculata]
MHKTAYQPFCILGTVVLILFIKCLHYILQRFKQQRFSRHHSFSFCPISEHRTQGLPVATQTDVCFVITSNNKIYDPHDGITLLDEPKYREVLSKTAYKTIDRGTCYQAQSSESQVKWRDLWWVLVAIAIFMFLCCVILLVTLIILYDRYKDQMRQPRMYMVSQ